MIDRKSLDLLAQAILDHLSANPELIGALVAESGLRKILLQLAATR